jgi:multidrug resistance protein, MATE family
MRNELSATLKLSIPIIITNMSQIALGLIDSAMVGAISYKQLAASSLALNAIAIPQIICIGLTIAISPLVAIARGRQDAVTASGVLYNGIWLNTLFSALVAIICVVGTPMLANLGQDPEVAVLAQPYFQIISWSLIPMIIFLSVKQFSDAIEMTKTGMYIGLVSLPVNALLNWIFIYGMWGAPRWELFGAGVGTLLTRVFQSIVMILIFLYHPAYKRYVAASRLAWQLKWKQIRELLTIGIPSGMQYAMEAGAFAVSGIMVGWLGATAQASHQIALNIASFSFMASLGLAQGGSIRVSHAFGRNDRVAMRRIGISTIYGGLCVWIFLRCLFYPAPVSVAVDIYQRTCGYSDGSHPLVLCGHFPGIRCYPNHWGGLAAGHSRCKTPYPAGSHCLLGHWYSGWLLAGFPHENGRFGYLAGIGGGAYRLLCILQPALLVKTRIIPA